MKVLRYEIKVVVPDSVRVEDVDSVVNDATYMEIEAGVTEDILDGVELSEDEANSLGVSWERLKK